MPTKSRMRAKTSLQAFCLSVRATASDSNPAATSFNHVVRRSRILLVVVIDLSRRLRFRSRSRARFQQIRSIACAFGLQITSEDSYCHTQYANFRCEGCVGSQRHGRDRHLFLRKTSCWPDAGRPAGTARSGKGLAQRDNKKS